MDNIDKQFIVNEFFKLVEKEEQKILGGCKFMGQNIWKFPTDCWNYQEILWDNKPDVLIETGTFAGGSAWYFAHLFDLIGNGIVISVDISNDIEKYPKHGRIEYIGGKSSIDDMTLEYLKNTVVDKKVMVILDSDHRKEHVIKEMMLYKDLVSVGQYMVVEDAGINGHPVYVNWGEGPYEAIEEFVSINKDFVIDSDRENKFLFTCCPKGWLKRIK